VIAVNDLTRELGKIRSRMGQAYADKLDGKIDERMWNDLHTRYTERQEALERQISAHTAADRNYLQQGIQILELANKAYNLYLQQPHEERAKLFRFVLLNCSLKDGNPTAVYRKPFDMLVNGVSHQQRRPFVEQFRTFCLSNPSAPNTALGLGDTLEELLATAI
jgi:hypothetical protein